jgi:hypothetical protein
LKKKYKATEKQNQEEKSIWRILLIKISDFGKIIDR